jgi:hypothetical protein
MLGLLLLDLLNMADEYRTYFFKLGTDLKTLMMKIWNLNFKTYNAVVDLQTRIPKEFGPCWIQEPVTFTDALDRVAPIHLELVNSWDVFESVLMARFKNLPGASKIPRREYALQDRRMKLDVERTRPFNSCFLPGRYFDMSMICKHNSKSNIAINFCPSCTTPAHTAPESETQW